MSISLTVLANFIVVGGSEGVLIRCDRRDCTWVEAAPQHATVAALVRLTQTHTHPYFRKAA